MMPIPHVPACGRATPPSTCTSLPLLVALLTVLPAARADTEADERLVFCKGCHRPGYSVSYVPTLDGQPREYLYNQLRAFKEKRRPSDGHQRYWGPLSEKDITAVADHFAGNPPVRELFPVDREKVASGRSIAESRQCDSCHKPRFDGKDGVPRLAGLHPQYAAGQIRAFAAGSRGHPRIDGRSGISAEDAEALGQYFAQVQ